MKRSARLESVDSSGAVLHGASPALSRLLGGLAAAAACGAGFFCVVGLTRPAWAPIDASRLISLAGLALAAALFCLAFLFLRKAKKESARRKKIADAAAHAFQDAVFAAQRTERLRQAFYATPEGQAVARAKRMAFDCGDA